MAYSYKAKSGGSTSRSKMIQVNTDLKISQENHDKLVQYLISLAEAGALTRDSRIDRFSQIDREVAGHIVPTKEDWKRVRDNWLGKPPKTVDENFQFTFIQIDEIVTYLLGVYAPEGSMYGAIAPKDQLNVANGLTALMNNHSRIFKHYRNMARSFLDMFKYNLGGYRIEWVEERGPKIQGSIGASPNVVMDQLLNSGNQLMAIDPYNTLFDPAVSPIDCPKKGQFIVEVDMIRPFTLEMMDAQNFYFGASKCEYNSGDTKFFRARPFIQHYFNSTNGSAAGSGQPNWDNFWGSKYGSGGNVENGYDGTAIERSVYHAWINPADFGLGPKPKMERWRFHLLGNRYLGQAEALSSVHNLLPHCIGMPVEDGLGLQSRTYAEMLLPWQRQASSQLNMKMKADRKRLYGVTLYNRRVVPQLDAEDLAGGKIAIMPASEDFDVGKAVKQLIDAPDTQNTMKDVNDALQMMRQMLPSVQSQQVADLQRATEYQSAAYVQASNRRNQKAAKLIDDQAMDQSRRIQLQNVLQYQSEMKVTDNQTGEVFTISPDALRKTDIEFAIADGLRGLDKLSIVSGMKDVINMLLQSQVARDYDVGAIIDYFLELQGDKFDFTQFKFKSPMDALDPKLKDLAFQLLQLMQTGQLSQDIIAKLQKGQAQGIPGGSPQNTPTGQAQAAALAPPGNTALGPGAPG